MIASAEEYASTDQEKRKNIDLKNSAEALCYEADKELRLFKDSIPEEKQNQVQSLIESIRANITAENFDALNLELEELRAAMKEMLDTQPLIDKDNPIENN